MSTKENIEQNQSELLPSSVAGRIQKIFPSFNPAELKEADFKMWQAVKDGRATLKNYEAYRGSVLKEEGRGIHISASSRLMFSDFLGDEMQRLLYHEQSS